MAQMQLQVALDGEWARSVAVLGAVRAYVDIAEIGTPLVFREGIAAAHRLREAFPDLPLLADLKIMDAGRHEAEIAFEAGCDVVTVLGLAADQTIGGALEAAAHHGGQVLADLIQVPDLLERATRLLDLGCHFLCVHTAFDLQAPGVNPLADLERLRRAFPAAPLAVAGGIRAETLSSVCQWYPQIVIVGSAITAAPDPAEAARQIRAQMEDKQ
jgi:3-hexulose-6-phosphate synthase